MDDTPDSGEMKIKQFKIYEAAEKELMNEIFKPISTYTFS